MLLPTLLVLAQSSGGADWPAFRGDGTGHTQAAELPLEWSADENITWKTRLVGRGHSSPVVTNEVVFVTSWSGYGETAEEPGDPKNLERHVSRIDLKSGRIV